jgi:uncharacterized protein (DUF1499 family)
MTVKPRLKRRFSTLLLFSALLLVFVALWASRFPMTNIAQTDLNSPDPQLHSRFYRASAKDVARTVQNAVPQLKTYGRRWKLGETTEQNEETTIRCQVPVLVFTDDVVVSLQETSGRTRLDVRSQSRIGKGDFGENKRHLLQLLRHLDAVLGTADKP